jgi:hypothetical protein
MTFGGLLAATDKRYRLRARKDKPELSAQETS